MPLEQRGGIILLFYRESKCLLINTINITTRNVLIRTLEGLVCTQTLCQKFIISFNLCNILRGSCYCMHYTDKEMESQRTLLALHKNANPVRGTKVM